ncbi:hypothetical protein DNU06_12230 [Putridiphycobacter roseus]|uniref:NfeD-like C-terminal domain-containing protein n=1 Tax=Putridiphycobacter roseus TaxID=2219161 RepID=A0A2W1NBD5_9FLAO|nr:hypothetical protein [Putridiphycobacter roseus]PZE16615.1 hypothetical protein DNU06_12230 [Putridiphycobacter roseus]
MKDFFITMSTLELVFWITALVGSAVFSVLLILSLFGGDIDTDVDVEIDGDLGIGIQFFTFKNVMAFFTLFGWTGIVCLDNQFSTGSAITVASLAGLAMMFILAFLFYWISRLAENGTLVIAKAIGEVGEVYLSVGANRSKMGKITIDVQGSKRELNALTDSKVDLKQGDVIKVTEVVSGEILLIEKLTK